MITLYEYGQRALIEDAAILERALHMWHRGQDGNVALNEEDEDEELYQPFLSFSARGIRARNYCGFIQHGDKLIEIYPKVFRQGNFPQQLMLRHIFYWFGYCRRWRFPFQHAGLDARDFDTFPELIIYQLARQFETAVSSQPLMLYEQVEEASSTSKGSIHFERYFRQQVSYGNFHRIEYDHEVLTLDNKANRVIKYCTRLLQEQARFPQTLRLLQDIIFVLDEVSDEVCTIKDIDQVKLNTCFREYELIMDSCRLILNQQLYDSVKHEQMQWCLLFPMEYIFEDFLAGFLQEKFSDRYEVAYQKSDKYLSDQPKAFQMRHDILLTDKANADRKIIIDAKYKIRPADFKSDKKKGIAQPDMYQVISYAYRRGCNEVLLLYPNTGADLKGRDNFEISSGFSPAQTIKVSAAEIPFWSANDFEQLEQSLYIRLEELLAI